MSAPPPVEKKDVRCPTCGAVIGWSDGTTFTITKFCHMREDAPPVPGEIFTRDGAPEEAA